MLKSKANLHHETYEIREHSCQHTLTGGLSAGMLYDAKETKIISDTFQDPGWCLTN